MGEFGGEWAGEYKVPRSLRVIGSSTNRVHPCLARNVDDVVGCLLRLSRTPYRTFTGETLNRTWRCRESLDAGSHVLEHIVIYGRESHGWIRHYLRYVWQSLQKIPPLLLSWSSYEHHPFIFLRLDPVLTSVPSTR